METKMKKIPFDLERAKKGEVFFFHNGDEGNHYIVDYEDEVFFWYMDDNTKFTSVLTIENSWYHLIPDEPKQERWAVVEKRHLYMFKKYDAAVKARADRDNYTVVKLAEDE